MNARSLDNSRAGLGGFGRLTTVALGFALALFFNIGSAIGDEPDPCKLVVFSTTDNEEFGCAVAAALHFGGTSLNAVRAHVARGSAGKRGEKWLKRFNKNLNSLARDTFWATFAYTFNRAEVKGWSDAEFVERLAESATRLDVLHQQKRTDNKVRALREMIKAAKEVAPAPPPPAPPTKKVQ